MRDNNLADILPQAITSTIITKYLIRANLKSLEFKLALLLPEDMISMYSFAYYELEINAFNVHQFLRL